MSANQTIIEDLYQAMELPGKAKSYSRPLYHNRVLRAGCEAKRIDFFNQVMGQDGVDRDITNMEESSKLTGVRAFEIETIKLWCTFRPLLDKAFVDLMIGSYRPIDGNAREFINGYSLHANPLLLLPEQSFGLVLRFKYPIRLNFDAEFGCVLNGKMYSPIY